MSSEERMQRIKSPYTSENREKLNKLREELHVLFAQPHTESVVKQIDKIGKQIEKINTETFVKHDSFYDIPWQDYKAK